MTLGYCIKSSSAILLVAESDADVDLIQDEGIATYTRWINFVPRESTGLWEKLDILL